VIEESDSGIAVEVNIDKAGIEIANRLGNLKAERRRMADVEEIMAVLSRESSGATVVNLIGLWV